MRHLHIQRNLRSLLFLAAALIVFAIPVGVWWVNHTGLPESWRDTIEEQLGRDGMHVSIGGLRYAPLKGLIATDVVFFSDEAKKDEYSRVEQVVVGFDKTKLARGKVEITRLRLINATFEMEFAEEGKPIELFEVNELNGSLLVEEGKRFEIKQMTGEVEGIEVEINARLVGRKTEGAGQPISTKADARRRFVAQALHELAKWNFDEDRPPKLRIWIEGGLDRPSSLRSKGVLEVERIERNGVALEKLILEGEGRDSVITINSVQASDELGKFEGRMDYDLEDKLGRFECKSSLDLLLILNAWFGVARPSQLLVGGGRELEAEGAIRLTESGSIAIETFGRVKCGSVMAKGVLLDQVESLFAWKNGSLYLRDLKINRDDGQATGKVMIEWPIIRLALDSTLPAKTYQPLFVGKPLEKIIGDFEANPGADCHLVLNGGFDATNRFSWGYQGSVKVKNMSYRDVPLTHVSCGMDVNRERLDFTNGLIGFDYRDYPMRAAFDGPSGAEAKVERVQFLRENRLVEVTNVNGKFWAAPMVRLFAQKTADHLETYRFHRPPKLKGNGVVDVTPQKRTSLAMEFQSEESATVHLLDKDVVLSQPKGKVLVSRAGVEINDLSGGLFGGPIQAQIHSKPGNLLEVESSWTKLSLPAIAKTYDLSSKAGGQLTGRLEFAVRRGNVGTMNGNGLIGLENSELFSVPMFGPLSPVIGGVLQDKKAGFETADSAFCSFTIENGVMETRDFTTSTRSLVFGGNGKVDLKEKNMDMTMRMNAKGLLGFLTIPLRPFYGMFQFRGTGPIRKPLWENVMFTAPPKEQEEALKTPPRAKVVEP